MRRILKLTESEDAYRIREGHASTKPALLLKGNWLDQAGFPAGSHAAIQVEQGRIVIEPQPAPRGERR